MPWPAYWAIVRRRWWIIAAIVLLDVLVSGYLYRKSTHAAGYQACLTLYVADVSSPSMIAAPDTTLRMTLIGLAIGGVILLPSLWYLFQIFKTAPADQGH